MIESRDIGSMSVAERLKAIEEIRDSLSQHADEVPLPESHGDILADRKARAESGEAKFLTLDQLRSRFRNSQT